MARLPHQSANKPAAVRKVIVTVPPQYAEDPRRAAGSTILENRERIKRLFLEALANLEIETGFPFTPISIDIQRRPVSGTTLVEILEMFNDSTIRGIADFADTDLDAPGTPIESYGISHLVSIRNDPEEAGWTSTPGVSDTVVCTDLRKIPLLIIDILLDIVAFYSWTYLVDNHSQTTSSRHEISLKKAQFALRTSLSSYYGPVSNPEITYFSFASACRNGTSFGRTESRRFEELWREFIAEEVLKAPPTEAERFLPKSSIVSYIRKTHSKGGELSESKLAAQIAPLGTGSYVLVRVEAWPKRDKPVKQILSIIGGKSRRRGTFRITTAAHTRKFLRHSRYLSFFTFQMHDDLGDD